MQRNWIGRSEGARGDLPRRRSAARSCPVFTTRPDTLFGATFFVLAPEHPLVERARRGAEHEDEVREYVAPRRRRARAVEREQKEKDGVFTGRYAINPVTASAIPIWVADYVLMEYGTGAIMAVPAHDERDHAFAEKYGLPILPGRRARRRRGRGGRRVRRAHRDEVLVNSGDFDGLPAPEAKKAIVAVARRARPRRGDDRLPPARLAALAPALLGLPDPDRPLRAAAASSPSPTTSCPWCCPRSRTSCRRAARRSRRPRTGSTSTCPRCGGPASARRTRWTRSSTRPGTSSATRDPHDDEAPFARRSPTTGCPSTSTSAAIEHAILHLIYARFFMKVMNEIGPRRLPRAVRAALQPGDDPLPRREDVQVEGQRRRPADFAERYGADTVRLFTLFMGPADEDMEWHDSGHRGCLAVPEPALARGPRAGRQPRRRRPARRSPGRRTRRSRR